MNPRLRFTAALTASCLGLTALGCAYAGVSSGPGMHTNAANAKLPDARNNLQLVRSLTDFGAKCDGTTDDQAAFTAATAWMQAAPNREVRIPAATCVTSQPVVWGNGRQQNTTLTATLSSGNTTATVASCSGVQAGDNLVIVRNDGSTYSGAVSTCSGTALSLSPAFSGGDAVSGKPVYTGKPSTYHGGGFVGYGPGATNGEVGAGLEISRVKYTGAAAPTTTLTALAAANATSLTVASTAGMSLGAPIGIALDNDRVWWTAVDYIASATSVVLMNALPSDAGSGKTVTIASNPVVRVQGPIVGARIEGVQLDANNLAAIGLDVQHCLRCRFRGIGGVQALNYTGIGHFLHSTRAYLGTVTGMTDNEFELFAQKPQNAKTIGLWALGGAGAGTTQFNVAFSRNRFWGGNFKMGGNDVTAAAVRVEFLDTNTFYKTITEVNGAFTAGAGIYRQPSRQRTGFPGANTWEQATLAGGANAVFDGSDPGGAVVGSDFYSWFNITDGASWPASAFGWDDAGNHKRWKSLKLDNGGSLSAPTFQLGVDGSSNPTGCWAPAGTNTLACGSGGAQAFQINAGQFQTLAARLSRTDTVTSGNYTSAGTVTDHVGVKKTVGAATSVTLTNTDKQTVTICDEKGDAAANPITVSASAGNIDGQSSYVISSNWGCAAFHRNDTTGIWKTVAVNADSGALATYTPTVTCGTGTPTTVSATGRYRKYPGRMMFLAVTVTFTTAGTCAGNVQVTLPEAAVAGATQQYELPGRDNGTGNMVVGTINGSNPMVINTYNNGCPCTNSSIPTLSGWYETAQ